MIHLKKIDANNVWDIVDLKVAEDQEEFVASNSDSIIDAYTTVGTGCSAIPFGIYDDEEPVGFLMIGHNMEAFCEVCGDDTPVSLKNNYLFWRLMVDEKFQGKGYGKAGIKLALDFIKTWPCGKAEYCVISYEPENEAAKNLYASFGFEENGEMADEEVVAVLKL
jgi:diamine N-acetyltransferase